MVLKKWGVEVREAVFYSRRREWEGVGGENVADKFQACQNAKCRVRSAYLACLEWKAVVTADWREREPNRGTLARMWDVWPRWCLSQNVRTPPAKWMFFAEKVGAICRIFGFLIKFQVFMLPRRVWIRHSQRFTETRFEFRVQVGVALFLPAQSQSTVIPCWNCRCHMYHTYHTNQICQLLLASTVAYAHSSCFVYVKRRKEEKKKR